MAKRVFGCAVLMFAFCALCQGQSITNIPTDEIRFDTKQVTAPTVPKTITRTIKQDSKGNIWIAAFDGIFRYDGKSFANITSKVSSAPFFSVLEDKKGNFWFSTIGSGVYYYEPPRSVVNGAVAESFRNFTTKDGLSNNEVTGIYEDKAGDIWFATEDGVSRYDPGQADGKSFRNFKLNEGFRNNDNRINSIIEDKTGQFWVGTKGNTFKYDGQTFTVLTHHGEPFMNVRTIMEDKKGNIWLGGTDGLWRYDGSTFMNFTTNFVGHIIEDKKGNIWTSSETANDAGWAQGWALSRYDGKSLSSPKPTVTEIRCDYEYIKKMIFGVMEASDGMIWFGALDGVYRYNGTTMIDYKGKEVK
ncbi:MAG: two-component regulator propeller domain-containing protein [Dyadobacter sp.]|uniref:ligand-binding sensor domain-containing protein n=1 Tax=Dyadobacter sp. TaxID=1914288 RepID=UPI003262EAAF